MTSLREMISNPSVEIRTKMLTIHKFSFKVDDTVKVALPNGAVIRHVGKQGGPPGHLTLWAEVNPDKPTVERTLFVRGTGHPLPDGAISFLGTVMDGPFVWHVYEPRMAERVQFVTKAAAPLGDDL